MSKKKNILELVQLYKAENKEVTVFLRNGKTFRGSIGELSDTHFTLISEKFEYTLTAGDCSAIMAARSD